jgi:cytochrome c-type biogenesis protein
VVLLSLAFVAGLLTIVSPCVLPLAPIVISGARADNPFGPLALAGGLAVTFAILGGILASFGIEIGETGVVRTAAAAIMLMVGLGMIVPSSGAFAECLFSPLVRFSNVISRHLPTTGLAGQAAVGAILAFAWAPCVGPTLGAALALAASGGSLPASMAIMMMFALGAAIALLSAGYGFRKIATRGRKLAGRTAERGRTGLGVAFAIVGVVILTGFEHHLEEVLIAMMPDWLVALGTRL